METKAHCCRSYSEIVTLRSEKNASKRGFLFEQVIRESLPWSYRPPIAIKTNNEQLDAFFEWNGWHFLVEAKAKKNPISPGSHDWEDFVLKVKNRKGQCIGLFCSLFDVSESVFDDAYILNRDGCTTILMTGKIWDELLDNHLSLSDYLHYMVSFARSTFKSIPTSIKQVKDYCHNVSRINDDIRIISTAISSTFLRRHKLARHEQIYVNRVLDSEIISLAKLLRPTSLSVVSHRKMSRYSKTYTHIRKCPYQAFIIRDLSGSGKTTLAVQVTLEDSVYCGVAKAANQGNIDDLPDYLSKIGDNYGLIDLAIANRPFVYVIDSLDESVGYPNKQKEIISLFRFLDELNALAMSKGYLCFPILLGFTLRDEYWRDWESVFEGRNAIKFNRRFSYFSPIELTEAIKLYSSAYHYRIEKGIDIDAKRVLSHPFNLLIFSEANEYKGNIPTSNILDENVLSLYFERKKEDIFRRPVPGLTGQILMRICSQASRLVALKGINSFNADDVKKIIKTTEPIISSYTDLIVHLLISEQIFVRDPEDSGKLRFRHMRFIEYLVAYYIAYRLDEENDPELLQKLISEIFNTEFLSIYYVHEFIRHICKSEFPELYNLLTDFYSQSSTYIHKLLSLQIINIAHDSRTSNLDIDTIIKSMDGFDPVICRKGFSVIAAKNNNQSKHKIITAFNIAWKSNKDQKDRWKLLVKMISHKLDLDEEVILKVLESDSPIEWYVFLEGIYEHGFQADFREAWKQLHGDKIQDILNKKSGPEWKRVNKIINIILNGSKYDPSSIY